jgi:hypothetical protein
MMDKSPPFTLLENPAIYDGGVERKCSSLIDDGVKAPLFLTGFTAGTNTETKDIDDAHRIGVRSYESQNAGIEKSISIHKG